MVNRQRLRRRLPVLKIKENDHDHNICVARARDDGQTAREGSAGDDGYAARKPELAGRGLWLYPDYRVAGWPALAGLQDAEHRDLFHRQFERDYRRSQLEPQYAAFCRLYGAGTV